jgi:predicted transglutaminase-like cysteine proteinase
MGRTLKIAKICAATVGVSTLSAMTMALAVVSTVCCLLNASDMLRYPLELRAKMQLVNFNHATSADQPTVFSALDRIRFDIPSLAPMAFLRFCVRYPQDCTIREASDGPELMSLTEMRRSELLQINGEVNRTIKPRVKTDDASGEEWSVFPHEGNCTDYAVTKRHELLAHGWPSHMLLLTEAVVPSGEHHLVLVVRTREDDFVLDNLDGNVRPISQIRYRWVRAQQPKNPRFWSTISVTRA